MGIDGAARAAAVGVIALLGLGCGAVAQRPGPVQERAATLEQSSRDAALRGDLARSVAFQEQAVAGYARLDAPASAAALNRLGNLRQQLGDRAGARTAYVEALARAERAGDRSEEAAAESNLGTLLEQSGDPAGARQRYERARVLAAAADDRATEATALNNLAMLAVAAGDDGRAQPLLEAALALDREGGDSAGLAVRLRNLAALDFRAGRLESAIGRLEEALVLDRAREDVPAIALDLIGLSEVRARAGDAAGAVADRRRAREIHRQLGLDERVQGDDAAIAAWCAGLTASLDCELAERPVARIRGSSGLPLPAPAR